MPGKRPKKKPGLGARSESLNKPEVSDCYLLSEREIRKALLNSPKERSQKSISVKVKK
jgi:hypothetical protein